LTRSRRDCSLRGLPHRRAVPRLLGRRAVRQRAQRCQSQRRDPDAAQAV